MSYNKNYFKHIQMLAWDLLIDSRTVALPVKLTPIATLYHFEQNIDYSKTRWDNTLVISGLILKMFGLNYSEEAAQKLSVRTLCPLCVLKECSINNVETLQETCDVPYKIAAQRLERLKKAKIRNAFYTSNLEKHVRDNFSKFIISYIENS